MSSALPSDDFSKYSLRQQAEIYWLLTGLGLSDFSGFIAWADRHIQQIDKPPIELIELSLAKNEQITEIKELIEKIPGEIESPRIAAIAMSHCRDAFLESQSSVLETLERCKSICSWLRMPEQFWYEIDKIDDDRLLEEQGVWEAGTAQKYLIEFLEKFSTDSAWCSEEAK